MSVVHSREVLWCLWCTAGRCCSVCGAQQGGFVVSMVHSIGRCCSVYGAQYREVL